MGWDGVAARQPCVRLIALNGNNGKPSIVFVEEILSFRRPTFDELLLTHDYGERHRPTACRGLAFWGAWQL